VHDAGETIEALGAATLNAFVLGRLGRFVALAADPRVRGIPTLRRLADHALDMALADCAALGLVDDAMAILTRALGDVHPA
jgi:hypothetical protein